MGVTEGSTAASGGQSPKTPRKKSAEANNMSQKSADKPLKALTGPRKLRVPTKVCKVHSSSSDIVGPTNGNFSKQ